jgi:hypothetical protein
LRLGHLKTGRYKRAFLGNELLQEGDAPIKGRYSWACITGGLDRNRGTGSV